MRAKILKTAAMAGLVFAVSAVAQEHCTDNQQIPGCWQPPPLRIGDTAYVPVAVYFEGQNDYPAVVNDYIPVTARRGNDTVSITVTPGQQKILAIPLFKLGGNSSVRNTGAAQGRVNAPAVTNSRGNISLRLPAQSYQKAEISLHSVNGKRVLRGKTTTTEATKAISRKNVAAGVYLLSVKGINGNTLTSRLTHKGGTVNISVAFGDGKALPDRKLAKSAEISEDWEIKVWTPGYYDSTYTLSLIPGAHPHQVITLRRIIHPLANCYWYEDGSGKYDYKCGFSPPCYIDPSCPMCDVCYPYPTICGLVPVDCPIDENGNEALCQPIYKCREVTEPEKFKLVEKGYCCPSPSCGQGGDCPTVCSPPIAVGIPGLETFAPIYACYQDNINVLGDD